MLQTDKYDVDRIFRLLVTLVTFVLLFSLIYYLRTILIPFAIAFIIANVLNPAVDYIQRFKVPRIVAIFTVFLIIMGILLTLFSYGIPYLISELSQFSMIFPKYISNIADYFSENFGDWYSQYIASYYTHIFTNLQASGFIDTIIEYITNIFSKLFNLLYLLIAAVIIVMYVFFLLRDIDRFRARWMLYIPERYRATTQMFVNDTYHYMVTFFRGQLTIVTILGILFSIGFSLVDIRLAIVLGFLTGLLNLIPNFGTLVAIVPAVLLAIGRAVEEGSNPLYKILGIALVFIVVQIIQDLVLTPGIMGKRTGLRPATILISVFVWGKLLGFLGIILAIPLTCLTKVYFARFILKENVRDNKSGG